MKRCPDCLQSFGDELTHCPMDGAELTARPPQKDPFIGRILAGRYEVLELLGRGGFGVVYKVMDRKMDDLVAIKVFDRRRFGEEEAHQAIQRFRREGVLLRRLGKRTNKIVIVYDFEEDDDEDLFYFTMDFVDGTTLTKVLADEGPLPLPRALDLGLQLCRALKAAHDEGIVHRDLKLDNIMITRDGDREIVKVLDFGIAKMVGSHSLTNLAMGVPGTAGFAPPEQLQRPQDIDHRTDLFSLGVVLYGLVTGRGPWSGEPIAEPTSSEKVWDLIRSSLEEDPIPIKKWRSDIPRRLESVIFTLLEKDQANRIQSAELLEEELKKVRRSATGMPDTGNLPGLLDALGAVARRFGFRPAIAFGGLSLILALALGGSWALSRRTPVIPLASLLEAVGEERILETKFDGDHLEAVLRGEDGGVRDVRADLNGIGIQELARNFRDRRIPIREEGRGLIRALPVSPRLGGATPPTQSAETTADDPLAPGASLHLEGSGDGCSPCEPAEEVRLASGWYGVRASGEEWILESISLRDRRGVFLEEEVESGGTSVFLPEGASLDLVSTFSPTQTRVLLTQAGVETAAGRPREALGLIEQAAIGAPESTWIPALRDTVLSDVRNRAMVAFESGEAQGAEEWLPICLELDAEDAECRRIREESEARIASLGEGVEEAGPAEASGQDRPTDPPQATPTQTTRTDPAPEAEGWDQPQPDSTTLGGDLPPGRVADPGQAGPPPAGDTAEAERGAGGIEPARTQPREPSPGLEAPSLGISDLSVGSFRFDQNQFAVEVTFSAVGPGDEGLCVAHMFGNEGLEPFQDADGQFALGGRVAVTQTYQPGTTPGPARLGETLAIDQLHQDRGPVRVVVQTRVWPGSCETADPSTPPLAEVSTQPICVVRYPAGWGVCREF